jgi:signal transduction histidine kinase
MSLNGIQIMKRYSSNIGNTELDIDKMQIAFLNIIINAIEAMEPGKGELEIGSFLKNKKCLIYIKDNGKGMHKDELSRVFEPYFTSKANGNGLGLTNTQNIILNHKGNIHVESTPGKGTAFIIALNCPEPTKEELASQLT